MFVWAMGRKFLFPCTPHIKRRRAASARAHFAQEAATKHRARVRIRRTRVCRLLREFARYPLTGSLLHNVSHRIASGRERQKDKK